ncbi:hypothetical protein [Curtobacterium sp. B18]|uniref:hypothetical protein n=1 Tax=Curtobacterium sp. B18 TaxID=95614 RepID=UPI001650EBD2|nr:hypothetical protein [Curtobacterium sp. B18]
MTRPPSHPRRRAAVRLRLAATALALAGLVGTVVLDAPVGDLESDAVARPGHEDPASAEVREGQSFVPCHGPPLPSS